MAGFLYKGVLLEQHKEPALSRDLREFFNTDTAGVLMDRPPVEHPDELTPLRIIDIARDAHIIDERDGVPLADKLATCNKHLPRLLVADAIDDEPYISSQLNPMLKHQELAGNGLSLAQRASGIERAVFAVYKNLTDLDIRIPKMVGGFPVNRIRGRYPAEYQASMTYASDDDALVIGVGALIHLASAVQYNKPQTTTFITVAGDCIGNPCNLEVSLGMTVTQVLERCGLIEDPSRIVVGGSMTGVAVTDTDGTLVIPTTRAILAFRDQFREMHLSCIGCSRCSHACPEGLNPYYLYHSIKYQRYRLFRTLDARMCIGCGTCSYVCPAKLNLSETIRKSSEKFYHTTGKMRLFSSLEKKRDDAEYESYMKDYELLQAKKAHKRALKAADKTLASRLSAAQSVHTASDNAADKALSDALHAKNASEQAADRKLNEALNTMHSAERSADNDLNTALKMQQASGKSADAVLAEALKARETADRDADKALAAALKTREAAESAADKAYSGALKAQASDERDAEKALSKVQRAKEPVESEIKSAQKTLDSIKAAGLHRQKAAEAACKSAHDDAQASYNAAEETCKKSKPVSQAIYEEAQKACAQAKADAQKIYEQAQEACAQAKENAKTIYAAAQVACEQEKAAALAVYVSAQAVHAHSKAEAQDAYEAECAAANANDAEMRVIIEKALAQAHAQANYAHHVASYTNAVFAGHVKPKFGADVDLEESDDAQASEDAIDVTHDAQASEDAIDVTDDTQASDFASIRLEYIEENSLEAEPEQLAAQTAGSSETKGWRKNNQETVKSGEEKQ